MNEADFAILAVVLISAAIGFFRGFIREILSLISWIIAFWAAFTFCESVSVYFEPYLDQPALRIAAAFATLFVIILLLLSILSYWLHKLMSASGIAGTDRILGGLFGIARAVVLVAIVLLLARLPNYHQEEWWQQSILIQQISPLVEFFHGMLPGDIAKQLQTV